MVSDLHSGGGGGACVCNIDIYVLTKGAHFFKEIIFHTGLENVTLIWYCHFHLACFYSYHVVIVCSNQKLERNWTWGILFT